MAKTPVAPVTNPDGPYLRIYFKGKLALTIKGEEVLDTDGSFDLVLTEDNVGDILEAATPQLAEMLDTLTPQIVLLMSQVQSGAKKKKTPDEEATEALIAALSGMGRYR
jgi:hypothetical protein